MYTKYELMEACDGKILYTKMYDDLEEAKEDLEAEFNTFVEDNNLEYSEECSISEDEEGIIAWALKDGKRQIWGIVKVTVK